VVVYFYSLAAIRVVDYVRELGGGLWLLLNQRLVVIGMI
jgi:hypothetical protein